LGSCGVDALGACAHGGSPAIVQGMSQAKTPGQEGYEAYYAHGKPGLTFDDRPMPTWDMLGQSPGGRMTQERWEVAAQAILARARTRLLRAIREGIQTEPDAAPDLPESR